MALRSVNNFELIVAADPQELTVLFNVASDHISDRGGTLLASHLPDILGWQALNQRHPLNAMLEYALPDSNSTGETTEAPSPPPISTPGPLRVVPLAGTRGGGRRDT